MAARSLAIRAALKTELLTIGNSGGSGWESGAGPPSVTEGRPKREAIAQTPERQLFVVHAGTEVIAEYLGAASRGHRYHYSVLLVCPDPANGEDMVSNLERDVRRAVQRATPSIEGVTLASAGFYEGPFEADDASLDELRKAGVAGGIVRLYADAITQKGAP